ncbi:hypothetical protein Raf01_94880 [Rugosimonospora africana]|uniref:Uncharacterized protein n=2 Tax=Rugosimonospora africana TaxID=556532 RepID=A0A8J3R2Z4_9ACTN|nr:hypothetical protein Raf01_94880 [Rugosimonospora africana]
MSAISGIDAEIVFLKDLSFQAEAYVSREFLANTLNTFIIRSPSAVLSSLAPLKPDFTEDEFGFLSTARMWQRVIKELGHPPIVVEGDWFRQNPEGVLRLYCERAGLEFNPQMLSWPDGRLREWAPDEQQSQAKWHSTLEHSNSILPPMRREPMSVDPSRAAMLIRATEVYDELVVHALKPDLDLSKRS